MTGVFQWGRWRRRGAGTLCAALLAAIAGPAGAMWDRVRWSASVEQVQAARRGQIVANEDLATRRVTIAHRAETLQGTLAGVRHVGGMQVQAVFWFDAAGRLLSVTETPEASDGPGSDTCAAFEAALAARYGAVDLVTVKGDERYLNWRDEPGRTRILFRAAGEGECTADYRELRGPLDR